MTAQSADVESVNVAWPMVNPGGRPFAPIAKGVALPAEITATFTLTSGLEVELHIVTRDRRPRIESVTLRGGPISSGDLRLPVAEWLDYVVATQAVPVRKGAKEGEFIIEPPDLGDLAPGTAAVGAARGRTVTRADLQAFVEAYQEGGLAQAQKELFLSEATAYRRLRKCRAEGLLPQKEES